MMRRPTAPSTPPSPPLPPLVTLRCTPGEVDLILRALRAAPPERFNRAAQLADVLAEEVALGTRSAVPQPMAGRRSSVLHVMGYGDSKSPTKTLPGSADPAAQPC
jgi:hypothetical protein